MPLDDFLLTGEDLLAHMRQHAEFARLWLADGDSTSYPPHLLVLASKGCESEIGAHMYALHVN